MINKKTIISLIASIVHGKKRTIIKTTIHPKREWFIGLALFIVIVFFGGVLSIANFKRFADIHLSLTASSQSVDSYKENTVKKALEIYAEKQNIFRNLVGTTVVQTYALPEVLQEIVVPQATSTPNTASSTLEIEENVPQATSSVETSSSSSRGLEVF